MSERSQWMALIVRFFTFHLLRPSNSSLYKAGWTARGLCGSSGTMSSFLARNEPCSSLPLPSPAAAGDRTLLYPPFIFVWAAMKKALVRRAFSLNRVYIHTTSHNTSTLSTTFSSHQLHTLTHSSFLLSIHTYFRSIICIHKLIHTNSFSDKY